MHARIFLNISTFQRSLGTCWWWWNRHCSWQSDQQWTDLQNDTCPHGFSSKCRTLDTWFSPEHVQCCTVWRLAYKLTKKPLDSHHCSCQWWGLARLATPQLFRLMHPSSPTYKVKCKPKLEKKKNVHSQVLTSAKVSRYGQTSNLEIHLRRMPFSVLNGIRRICACSVPLTFSNLWLHVVPSASGINLVTYIKNQHRNINVKMKLEC